MTARDVIQLIEGGENLSVEFKQRFSTHEKMAKEMIAFANTKGGYILIGIDDNKSIYGVESEKGEAELVKETALKYCMPEIEFQIHYVEVDHKEIVVIEIAESSNKPHRIQDYLPQINLNTAQVFVRINDKSVPASKEMIKILQARAKDTGLRNYVFGKTEKSVFEYLKNKDSISVKDFAEYANISGRRASRTLIKLVRADLLNIHTRDNGENFFTSAV